MIVYLVVLKDVAKLVRHSSDLKNTFLSISKSAKICPKFSDIWNTFDMISLTCFRTPAFCSFSSSRTFSQLCKAYQERESKIKKLKLQTQKIRSREKVRFRKAHLFTESEAEPAQVLWLLQQCQLNGVLQLAHRQPGDLNSIKFPFLFFEYLSSGKSVAMPKFSSSIKAR